MRISWLDVFMHIAAFALFLPIALDLAAIVAEFWCQSGSLNGP
jgi:hypothetical protein